MSLQHDDAAALRHETLARSDALVLLARRLPGETLELAGVRCPHALGVHRRRHSGRDEVERVRVDDLRTAPASQRPLEEATAAVRCPEPGADSERVESTVEILRQVVVGRQVDVHRLRHRGGDAVGQRGGNRHGDEARAAAQGRASCEHGGAAHPRRPGDEEDPAVVSLVRVTGAGWQAGEIVDLARQRSSSFSLACAFAPRAPPCGRRRSRCRC